MAGLLTAPSTVFRRGRETHAELEIHPTELLATEYVIGTVRCEILIVRQFGKLFLWLDHHQC